MLRRKGYRIRIRTPSTSKKSHQYYNLFSYIHSEKDIFEAGELPRHYHTKGEAESPGTISALRRCYMALIGYIHYEAPEEEQNFSTLLEMITPWRSGGRGIQERR